MNKFKLNAVHKGELEEFLSSIDELETIRNGKAKCEFCGKKITLENIQTIFPMNGEIAYCCNSALCFIKFERMENGDR